MFVTDLSQFDPNRDIQDCKPTLDTVELIADEHLPRFKVDGPKGSLTPGVQAHWARVFRNGKLHAVIGPQRDVARLAAILMRRGFPDPRKVAPE